MPLEHLDRPCALYALYEGHGARGATNVCAEYCATWFRASRGFW